MATIEELKRTLAQVQERWEALGKAVDRAVAFKQWANDNELGNVADELDGLVDDLRKLRQAAADRIADLKKRIDDKSDPGEPRPSVMFDAVTVGNIPADAKAYGCYVGPGTFTCEAANRRCPDARAVKITQAGHTSTPADCVDVEPQDATNTTGVDWLKNVLGKSFPDNDRKVPVVYTSASNAKAFIDYAKGRGVDRDKYRLWSAHYGRGEHICAPGGCGYPQADGTQWTSTYGGKDLDASKLNPSFWD